LQQFQSFQLINPNEVTAQHGLDMVHFDFVGGCVIENQTVINQVKDLIFIGVLQQQKQTGI
jgi:hypothetical protein